MGEVVELPRRPRAGRKPFPGGPCEVSLFTGVRYERRRTPDELFSRGSDDSRPPRLDEAAERLM